MIIAEGMALIGIALLLGTLGALALSRFLGALRFDIGTTIRSRSQAWPRGWQ